MYRANVECRPGAIVGRALGIFSVVLLLCVGGCVGVIYLVMEGLKMADRTRCELRLSQLGLAMHTYQLKAGQFPPGQKDGNTFYWEVRDLLEVGDSVRPVDSYLCAARRRPSTCAPATAPADYGFGDPSELGSGFVAVLASPQPVRPDDIKAGRGLVHTLVLGHIGLRPSKYAAGENDGTWKTNFDAYRRDAFTFRQDAESPEMPRLLGGPHEKAAPFLFMDRSVRNLKYAKFPGDPESRKQLGLLWSFGSTAPIDAGRLE